MLLKNALAFLVISSALNTTFAEGLENVIDPVIAAPVQAVPQEVLKKASLGPDDILLYHRSIIQVGLDVEQWIAEGRTGVAKVVAQSADLKACYSDRGVSYCEKALQALLPYSVIPLKDGKIFELGRQLREEKFEFQLGVRVFQLTSALRFFVKEELYNGVEVPKTITSSSVKRFVAEVQGFHEAKVIDVRKGRANLPALPQVRK